MIPAQLQREAEVINAKRDDDSFLDGAEWLFQRLCEMSDAEWTVELTNAALDAGSRPISDPLNTTVAFVNGARHQHALDQAALLKAREEIARLNTLLSVRAGAAPLDISDIIKALDGVVAVNLEEPSPGDLKRLYDGYHEERARCERYEKALKDIIWSWDNDAGRACYELARQALSGDAE